MSEGLTSGVTTTFPQKNPYPFEPTVGQVPDFYPRKSCSTKRHFITDFDSISQLYDQNRQNSPSFEKTANFQKSVKNAPEKVNLRKMPTHF